MAVWIVPPTTLGSTPPGRPVTILAFGDSLTAGYGLPADQAFPAVLESKLRKEGYHVKVINAGVSGDTAEGGALRLSWVLGDRPDIAIVELGANDALRAHDPAGTEFHLDRILQTLKRENIRVLLAGMLAPSNLGEDFTRRFNGLFPRLARKHQVLFFPFFLEGVAGRPAFNQADGLHPNHLGVKIIVDNIYPYVKQLVEDIQP